MKQLLISLSKAIKGDRRFFVTAKTDPGFDPIKIHVDDLLNQLTKEAKIKAEKEIASAQLAINEMGDWHTYEAASSEYNSALSTITKARESFQTSSYFGYLDAQSLAGEAKNKALATYQKVRDNLCRSISVRIDAVEWFLEISRAARDLSEYKEIARELELSKVSLSKSTYSSITKARIHVANALDLAIKLTNDRFRRCTPGLGERLGRWWRGEYHWWADKEISNDVVLVLNYKKHISEDTPFSFTEKARETERRLKEAQKLGWIDKRTDLLVGGYIIRRYKF